MIPLNKSDGQKELVPTGSHVARLYSIVQIGTVPDDFRESGFRHVLRMTWELPEEMRDFNGEMKPMVIGGKYTVSLHEKSGLRPVVEGMLGKLTEEDLEHFSFESLVGTPCMVSVVHKVSKTGRDYAAVSSVSQVPKKLEVPKQINPSVYLDYREGWNQETYNNLPQFIKDDMAESKEMRERLGFSEKNDDIEHKDIPF